MDTITIEDEILEYVQHNPGVKTKDIIEAVGGGNDDILAILIHLVAQRKLTVSPNNGWKAVMEWQS